MRKAAFDVPQKYYNGDSLIDNCNSLIMIIRHYIMTYFISFESILLFI